MEFRIPLQFEDLENERHESSGRLYVKDSLGLGGRDLSESELATEVQQACFELGEYDAQMVSQQSLFDRLYFLLKVKKGVLVHFVYLLWLGRAYVNEYLLYK